MLAPTLWPDDIVMLDNLTNQKAVGVAEAIAAQGAQNCRVAGSDRRHSSRFIVGCTPSCLLANALGSVIQHNSGAAAKAQIARDLDRCDLPFATCIDQQWASAHAIRSQAVIAQKKTPARIDKAAENAALRIRH